jgi:hypothetical protein
VVEEILKSLAARHTVEVFLAEGFKVVSRARPLLTDDDFESVWNTFEQLVESTSEVKR